MGLGEKTESFVVFFFLMKKNKNRGLLFIPKKIKYQIFWDFRRNPKRNLGFPRNPKPILPKCNPMAVRSLSCLRAPWDAPLLQTLGYCNLEYQISFDSKITSDEFRSVTKRLRHPRLWPALRNIEAGVDSIDFSSFEYSM